MPIHGVTGETKKSNAAFYPAVQTAIKCFKGRPQQKGKPFGEDLEHLIRVECSNPTVTSIIKRAYNAQEVRYQNVKKDSPASYLIVDKLNIYFPFPDVERNFPTTMEAYAASGINFRCDGKTIYEKAEKFEAQDGVRRQVKPCKLPCAANGDIGNCPNKCQKTGRIVFHIKEVFEAGFVNKAAIMTVHSWSDVPGIERQLNEHIGLMANLSRSPFPSPLTHGFVPFVMSRTQTPSKKPVFVDKKRTGAYKDAFDYPVSIDVNPQWLAAWMQWQQVEQMQALGMQVNPHALRGMWDDRLLLSSADRLQVSTLENSEVMQTFKGLLERCTNLDQLDKAVSWLKSPNQWSRVQDIPGITAEIDRLVGNVTSFLTDAQAIDVDAAEVEDDF